MGEEGEHLGVTRIGVIADTHGLLRPEVAAVFANVDHILHAGDIGGDHIIKALQELAPVTFVRGNNDDDDGYESRRVTIGGLRVLLTHILPRPHDPRDDLRSALASSDVVVFGHSHLPHDEHLHNLWFFNPASAGPRRFDYPISVGLLEKKGGQWAGQHVALEERSTGALKQRMNQLSGR